MNETELIKRYREILNEIYKKESYLKWSKDPDKLKSELEKHELEKQDLISKLKSCEKRDITKSKTNNIRGILVQLLNKFSRTDYPHKFSRDQGLIIQSFILIRIAEDISGALDHDFTVVSEYYLEVGSEFSCDEIIRILKDSIRYIDSSKINDYVELFDFVRSIQKQIVSLDKDCGRMTI